MQREKAGDFMQTALGLNALGEAFKEKVEEQIKAVEEQYPQLVDVFYGLAMHEHKLMDAEQAIAYIRLFVCPPADLFPTLAELGRFIAAFEEK